MSSHDEKINELLTNKKFFNKIPSMKAVQEVVEELNEEALESVSGGGEKIHQFKQGYMSGVYGPVWAYGYMSSSNYDEPKSQGEKAAHYAGIAIGVMEAVMSAGIPWLVGSAREILFKV